MKQINIKAEAPEELESSHFISDIDNVMRGYNANLLNITIA